MAKSFAPRPILTASLVPAMFVSTALHGSLIFLNINPPPPPPEWPSMTRTVRLERVIKPLSQPDTKLTEKNELELPLAEPFESIKSIESLNESLPENPAQQVTLQDKQALTVTPTEFPFSAEELKNLELQSIQRKFVTRGPEADPLYKSFYVWSLQCNQKAHGLRQNLDQHTISRFQKRGLSNSLGEAWDLVRAQVVVGMDGFITHEPIWIDPPMNASIRNAFLVYLESIQPLPPPIDAALAWRTLWIEMTYQW